MKVSVCIPGEIIITKISGMRCQILFNVIMIVDVSIQNFKVLPSKGIAIPIRLL